METGRPRWHLRELEVQTPGWVVLLTYSLLWPSFPLLQERPTQGGYPRNPTGIPVLPSLTLDQPNLPGILEEGQRPV